jgi:hypothetical protein
MNDNKPMDNRETYGSGEKDPRGYGQHDPGAKTDEGKPDCSLLLMFGKALRAVAGVGTFGAVKYTRGGWQEVPDGINRYTAALIRHLCDEHYEEFDKDLPVRHAAQVAWNALARLELILRKAEMLEKPKEMIRIGDVMTGGKYETSI